MLLCCTVDYKWVTVMDGVKFDMNCIRKTILTENGQSAYDITKYI